MGSQHEEKMECPCPCHESGGTCSICASTEGKNGSAVTDPVEIGALMWQRAFFKANMEFMAEKLKKKFEAAWGPMADKAADALIEKMGKQWQAMVQQAGADEAFREKLAKIYSEGQK
jgi:hypothetical protein